MKLRIALASVALAACAGSDADFHVHFAPDVPHQGQTVSILGIYKDGRLAPESWETLGGALASSFSGTCSPGFDDALAVRDQPLANAIDDYSRANGLSDDLLEKLAPAAQGDAIVVFTVAGHPPHQVADTGPSNGTPLNTGPTSTPGRHGARGLAPTSMAMARPTNAYEISAALYSVRAHKSVGLVAMSYTGPSADEAMKAFAEKVKLELGNDSCTGWSWKGKVDADVVHAMKDE